jgi:hypothetical protein
MTDVTRILSAIGQGDPQATKQIPPLVDDELRRPVAEKTSSRLIGKRNRAWRASLGIFLQTLTCFVISG